MTLQQIKDDYAKEKGFKTWFEFILRGGKHGALHALEEIPRRYAMECCKATLEKIRHKQNHLDGIEGCTWGDIEHDSISAAFGYNQAIDEIRNELENTNNIVIL